MELKNILEKHGYPTDLPHDGTYHRFPIGNSDGQNGFFTARVVDGKTVFAQFGDWSDKKTWVTWKGEGCTNEIIKIAETKHSEAKQKIQDETASQTPAELAACQPARPDHSYCRAKGLSHAEGALFDPKSGCLFIPVRDIGGKQHGYEKIREDGKKRFRFGTRQWGNFCLLGATDPRTIQKANIVEGWATGVSVYEATQTPTVVAFSCGNLRPVVQALKAHCPNLTLLNCADDDRWPGKNGQEKRNAGMEMAAELLRDFGVKYVVPRFAKIPPGQQPKDFNDLFQLEGPKALQNIIGRTDNGPFAKTLEELAQDADTDPPWRVEGLLPEYGFSIMAGQSKAGKSTRGRELALAVATGGSFLGRKCHEGPVLYLALEEKPRYIIEHLKLMGATLKEPIYTRTRAVFTDLIEELTKFHTAHGIKLVILDTLFKCVKVENNDTNNYMAVQMALQPLLDWAEEKRVSILGVHHLNKDKEADDNGSVMGSEAIMASVDTLIFLRVKDGERTIHTRQRNGEDLEKTVMTWDKDTRTSKLGGSVAAAGLERNVAKVLGSLGKGGKDLDTICGLTGFGDKTARKYLKAAMDMNRAECKEGPKGKLVYTLKEYSGEIKEDSQF